MSKDTEQTALTFTEAVEIFNKQSLARLLNNPPQLQSRSVNYSIPMDKFTPPSLESSDANCLMQECIYKLSLERTWDFESQLLDEQIRELIARLNAWVVFILKAPGDRESDNAHRDGFSLERIMFILAPEILVPIIQQVIKRDVKIISCQSATIPETLRQQINQKFKCNLERTQAIPNISDALQGLAKKIPAATKIILHPFYLHTEFDVRPRLIPNVLIYDRLINHAHALLLSRVNENDAWYLFSKNSVLDNPRWNEQRLGGFEKEIFKGLKDSKEEHVFTIVKEISPEKIAYLKSKGILIYEATCYVMIACRSQNENQLVIAYINNASKEIILAEKKEVVSVMQKEKESLGLEVVKRIELLSYICREIIGECLDSKSRSETTAYESRLIENFEIILKENHPFNFESLEEFINFINNMVTVILVTYFINNRQLNRRLTLIISPEVKIITRNRIFSILLASYFNLYVVNKNLKNKELYELLLSRISALQYGSTPLLIEEKCLSEYCYRDILIEPSIVSQDVNLKHYYWLKIFHQEILEFYSNIPVIRVEDDHKTLEAINVFLHLLFKINKKIIGGKTVLDFFNIYFEIYTFLMLLLCMNHRFLNEPISLPAQSKRIISEIKNRIQEISNYPSVAAEVDKFLEMDFVTIKTIELKILFLKKMLVMIWHCFFMNDKVSLNRLLNHIKTNALPNMCEKYDSRKGILNKLRSNSKAQPELEYQFTRILIVFEMISTKSIAAPSGQSSSASTMTDQEYTKEAYLKKIYELIPKFALNEFEIMLCQKFLSQAELNSPCNIQFKKLSKAASENTLREALKFKTDLTEATQQLQMLLFGIKTFLRDEAKIILHEDVLSLRLNFSNSKKTQFQKVFLMRFQIQDISTDKSIFSIEVNDSNLEILREVKDFFGRFVLIQEFFSHYGFSNFNVEDNLRAVSIITDGVNIKIGGQSIELNDFLGALKSLRLDCANKDGKLMIMTDLKKFNKIKPKLSEDTHEILEKKFIPPSVQPNNQVSQIQPESVILTDTPVLAESVLPEITVQPRPFDSANKPTLKKVHSFLFRDKNNSENQENASKALTRTTSYYLGTNSGNTKNSSAAEQLAAKFVSQTPLTAREKRLSRQISKSLPKLFTSSVAITFRDKNLYLNLHQLRTVELESSPSIIYLFLLRENEMRASLSSKGKSIPVLINPFDSNIQSNSEIDLTKAQGYFSRKLCKAFRSEVKNTLFDITIKVGDESSVISNCSFAFELRNQGGKERVFCISIPSNHPNHPIIIPIYYADKGLHGGVTIKSIVEEQMILDLTNDASFEPYSRIAAPHR
ncbi:MAG: hypothetical protein JSS53_04105 [Proteobacteria bacterium]|nr:hypothetical protein [Pseudomonadota bacterium]